MFKSIFIFSYGIITVILVIVKDNLPNIIGYNNISKLKILKVAVKINLSFLI